MISPAERFPKKPFAAPIGRIRLIAPVVLDTVKGDCSSVLRMARLSAVTLPIEHDADSAPGGIEVHVTFETTLGLLAAFFIGFFAPVAGGIFIIVGVAKHRPALAAIALILTILSGRAAIMIARMAAQASMGWLGGPPPKTPSDDTASKTPLPFALAMAALLPHYSWFYRPLLSTWWLAHFCGAAAFGHTVAMSLIQRLDPATAVLALPLAVVVHFAFLFASNLYLVLAARAILRSPKFCVRVWQYRFVIDAVIATALVLGSRR